MAPLSCMAVLILRRVVEGPFVNRSVSVPVAVRAAVAFPVTSIDMLLWGGCDRIPSWQFGRSRFLLYIIQLFPGLAHFVACTVNQHFTPDVGVPRIKLTLMEASALPCAQILGK